DAINGVGTADDHVLVAAVLEIVTVRTRGRRIVADHIALGIETVETLVELSALVDLEEEARGGEDVAGQMRGAGVRHDQLGERIVLQFGEEVHAGGTLQVVEAVAVLQLFELLLEHEVEGRTQEAAERHLLFGETTDPQVDVVDAGGGDAVDAGPGAG